MIKKTYRSLSLTVLTLSFSLLGGAQSDTASIKKPITDLFDGMRRSDTAMMRRSFATGALLQSVFRNREGKLVVRSEPVDSFLHSIAKPHAEVYDERIVFESIRIDGDLATAWVPYKFYLGEKFLHCGVDAFQLVRTESGWKILHLTDTRRRQDCERLPGF